MTLALPRLLLSFAYRLHDEFESMMPAHEGLAVDVFVILGEIKPTAQTLVDGAPIVLCRQSEFRLDGAAEQRAAIFIQTIALHLNSVRRPPAGLDVGERKTQILEPEAADRFESKHVPD